MKAILQTENMMLNLPKMEKAEAIYQAAMCLEKNGYVTPAYYPLMLQKEEECETYIGNGVAIPHGISHSDQEILHSGIVLLQFRDAIDWNGHPTHLVIGIAGKQNEHMELLARIACTLQDIENVKEIVKSEDPEAILKRFAFTEE